MRAPHLPLCFDNDDMGNHTQALSLALMESAKKRAAKLEAKGKPVDFKELLRMEPDAGTTNIRNTASKHWQRWLGRESRCVVPFTSFSENEVLPSGARPHVWFARDESRPLMFFAGIWMKWTVGAQSQNRRGDDRRFRLPDDGTERRGRADPSQGHARHPDDSRGGRNLDDGADA
jgi:hypothetical protein